MVGYILDLTHSNFHVMLYVMVDLMAAGVFPAIQIRQSIRPAQLHEGCMSRPTLQARFMT